MCRRMDTLSQRALGTFSSFHFFCTRAVDGLRDAVAPEADVFQAGCAESKAVARKCVITPNYIQLLQGSIRSAGFIETK